MRDAGLGRRLVEGSGIRGKGLEACMIENSSGFWFII
jgi:hypothetical protein